MTDKPIVIVTGGGDRTLTEQITELFGQDLVVVVDDLSAVEREVFDRPLRMPEPLVMEIVMRGELADDVKKFMAGPIYLDRPAKDWEQHQRRGRMKPRRR